MIEKSRGNTKEAIAWQNQRIAADAIPSLTRKAFLAELLLHVGDNRSADPLCALIY